MRRRRVKWFAKCVNVIETTNHAKYAKRNFQNRSYIWRISRFDFFKVAKRRTEISQLRSGWLIARWNCSSRRDDGKFTPDSAVPSGRFYFGRRNPARCAGLISGGRSATRLGY